MNTNTRTVSHQEAIKWFSQSQVDSVIQNGVIPEWFHGVITRKESERLLKEKPPGHFLIRVSESRIGYTLTYRTRDCIRHFMIDVPNNSQYQVVGESQVHRSLQNLVDYHKHIPVVPFNEVLTIPCGQAKGAKADYEELLFSIQTAPQNPRSEKAPIQCDPDTETSPPPLPSRSSPHFNWSHPGDVANGHAQDISPSPPVNSQPFIPGSLYPCLSLELGSPSFTVDVNALNKPQLPPRNRPLVMKSKSMEQLDVQGPALPPRNLKPLFGSNSNMTPGLLRKDLKPPNFLNLIQIKKKLHKKKEPINRPLPGIPPCPAQGAPPKVPEAHMNNRSPLEECEDGGRPQYGSAEDGLRNDCPSRVKRMIEFSPDNSDYGAGVLHLCANPEEQLDPDNLPLEYLQPPPYAPGYY
ncbi:hematopoietic SH2 domain-containing protein homolog [Polypterus senegalus]|uniref:hematopoietic SH2 domain-containing protein homolog n=1 Tax=Polypterus senegalus TaxID=55291 RepID=UPI0019636FC7|nr:hematopoietic SH2 domain-containing protein homolog [Polypterus senegalus]